MNRKEYKSVRIYALKEVDRIINEIASEGWMVVSVTSVQTGINVIDTAGAVSEIQSHLFVLFTRDLQQ